MSAAFPGAYAPAVERVQRVHEARLQRARDVLRDLQAQHPVRGLRASRAADRQGREIRVQNLGEPESAAMHRGGPTGVSKSMDDHSRKNVKTTFASPG